jgi:hypothetical protein
MNEESQELKLIVPTYLAERHTRDDLSGDQPDFGEPNVPVLIREAEGVRIVLGTHDYDNYEKPDIQIERRPNGWAIFLHPLGGSDPSGFIYFLDDGRSFLAKDYDYGPTEAIQVLEPGEKVRELDWPSEEPADSPSLVMDAQSGLPQPLECEEGPKTTVTITLELDEEAMAKLRKAAAKQVADEFALVDAIDEVIDGDSLFDAAFSALAAAVRGAQPERQLPNGAVPPSPPAHLDLDRIRSLR